jgi:F-box interacting protein
MASSFKPHAAPKRRALATFNIGALPLDLLVYEILLRLPAKLLCRLRTVCRLWRSILSDPHFAAAHAMRHPGPLIIAAIDERPDVHVNIMDLSGQILKQVRGVPGQRVVSTALDLVFVKKTDSSSSSYRFCNPFSGDVHYLPDQLLNPATGAVYQIPNSFAEEHRDFTSSFISQSRYLFGQVSSTGEYKVFRKLYHLSVQFGGRQLLEICTVNGSNHTGWRAVTPLEKNIQFGVFTSVVINGIIYSQCFDPHHSITYDCRATEEDLIITFDIETEKWGPFMRGPPISFSDAAAQVFNDLRLPPIKQLTLANLNGSLAVVHGPAPSMDIWILMDSGKGLWVKQYIIQFKEYASFQYVHPLVVLRDGRVVLYKEDMQLLQIYDPRTNTLTDSVEVCHFSAVALFGGNLLSL